MRNRLCAAILSLTLLIYLLPGPSFAGAKTASAIGEEGVTAVRASTVSESGASNTALLFRPSDGATGDVTPIYYDGLYYLFFLHSENYKWCYVTTEDFVDFSGITVLRDFGGTGDVLNIDGTWHLFSSKAADGAEVIHHYTGTSLTELTDTGRNITAPTAYVSASAWRDPRVWYDETTGQYRMLVATWLRDGDSVGRNGGIAAMTSPDLYTWTYAGTWFAPGYYPGACECPDRFQMGDWYYLVYSDCSYGKHTYYAKSKTPDGPWEIPERDAFDSLFFYAAKTVSDGNDRYLLGWAADRTDQTMQLGSDGQLATLGYAGNMIVHKLVQQPNGDLVCAPVDALVNTFQKSVPNTFTDLNGSWKTSENGASVNAPGTYATLRMEQLPEQFLLQFHLRTQAKQAGVLLNTDPGFAGGSASIYLDRTYSRLAAASGFLDLTAGGYYPFAAEVERPLTVAPDRTYQITILCDGDIAVTYVDGACALTFRMAEAEKGALGLFCYGGSADFSEITLKTLSGVPEERLLAKYTFDDETTRDALGAHNAILYDRQSPAAGTYSDGISGKALRLSTPGAEGRYWLSVPYSVFAGSRDSFTISLWYLSTGYNTEGEDSELFSFYNSKSEKFLYYSPRGSGYAYPYTMKWDGTYGFSNVISPYEEQTWKHLTYCVEPRGSETQICVYLNGKPAAIERGGAWENSLMSAMGIDTFTVGGKNPYKGGSVPNCLFYGLIDELEIFSGTLSGYEAAALYREATAAQTTRTAGTPAPKAAAGATLLAEYNFDQNSTADSVGGHDAVLYNGSAPALGNYTSGIEGSALCLSGQGTQDQYWLDIPVKDLPSLGNTMSLSLWFRATGFNASGEDSELFSLYNSGAGKFIYYAPRGATYERPYIMKWDGTYGYANPDAGYAENQWNHLVFCIRGAEGESRISVYLNGAEVNVDQGGAWAGSLLSDLGIDTFTIGGKNPYKGGPVPKCLFYGMIDEVKIYSGELTQQDAAALYGSVVTEKSDSLFLDLTGGGISNVIPVWNGDRCYVFFQREGSEKLCWATTTDFLNYSPVSVLGTFGRVGSVLYADNAWHLFSTVSGSEGAELLHYSGNSLLTLRRTGSGLRLDAERFGFALWQDPQVVPDASGGYRMLLSAAEQDGGGRTAAIVCLTSQDLNTWTGAKTLFAPGRSVGLMEAPDLFRMGEWYYLVYTDNTGGCRTRYVKARDPDGPWIIPAADELDAQFFSGGRTVSNGTERYLIGRSGLHTEEILPLPNAQTPADFAAIRHTGGLVVHRLEQTEHGDLIAAPLNAADTYFTKSVANTYTKLSGNWTASGTEASVTSEDRFSALLMQKLPERFLLRFTVETTAKQAGIGLNVDRSFAANGYYLFLDREYGRLRKVSGALAHEPGYYFPAASEQELPVGTAEDDTYEITVICDGGLAVVYVDGACAMTVRMEETSRRSLGLFCYDGSARFSGIRMTEPGAAQTAHTHQWKPDFPFSVPATCTESGTERQICDVCGSTKAEPVPALGHAYVTSTVPPTTLNQGYDLHVCSRCGDWYRDHVTERLDPPETDPCVGYVDVDRAAWYHAAVDFVISQGLMKSNESGRLAFAPNTSTSRAMIVVILYRLSGQPDIAFEPVFSDVPEGRWYTVAVVWAAKNGVVSGYGNGKFGPNDYVSREQLAQIMMGYTGKIRGMDVSARADLSVFPDGAQAGWSKTAMQWAVATGLISGRASGGRVLLAPRGAATRAETASILMRYLRNTADQ